jgi:repressor of nif and glnA expression
MSWETFKQNILRVANNPQSINDIDIVAKTYATEYDAAVKRGGDTVNSVPIKKGNFSAMEQIFKSALQKGLSSTEPYDLVGEMEVRRSVVNSVQIQFAMHHLKLKTPRNVSVLSIVKTKRLITIA